MMGQKCFDVRHAEKKELEETEPTPIPEKTKKAKKQKLPKSPDMVPETEGGDATNSKGFPTKGGKCPHKELYLHFLVLVLYTCNIWTNLPMCSTSLILDCITAQLIYKL